MCARKSFIQPVDASSTPGKSIRSGYRVLRGSSRGDLRSVDRNHAGRNAKPEGSSVKGSSPDRRLISVMAEQVLRSEGSTGVGPVSPHGITGVQDHGMYKRRLLELGRSLKGRTRMFEVNGQGFKTKSKTNLMREVRWSHSSWEVG